MTILAALAEDARLLTAFSPMSMDTNVAFVKVRCCGLWAERQAFG